MAWQKLLTKSRVFHIPSQLLGERPWKKDLADVLESCEPAILLMVTRDDPRFQSYHAVWGESFYTESGFADDVGT